MKLRISDSLSLPADAITQKLAFLGRTGSGKTYGATKLAELMLDAKAQIIALDPVGVWWGLRTSTLDVGPGKGGGFSIPVFGGLHGDIPLEPGAGAMIADVVVERGLSAVLDVSQMLASEQGKFATDFVTQLFQRKKAAPAAMHIFLEEAQEFVPQNVDRGEQHKVHAFERLVKLGRNFGIGVSLISQRPQEVNKKALNQTECLFAFQMTGPQERKAIEAWVAEKGVNEDIVSVLPHLAVGEPHIWSPQWLKVSRTVRIAAKVTADVSSTPKLGERRSDPARLTAVDLKQLQESMRTTIEAAKANDPAELKRRIRELEKQAKADDSKGLDELAKRVEDMAGRMSKAAEALGSAAEDLDRILRDLKSNLGAVGEISDVRAELQRRRSPVRTSPPPPIRTNPVRSTPAAAQTGSKTNSGMRRMMIALAQRPGLSKRQLGVRAGLSSSSGTFGTYLSQMRSNGWLDGERDALSLTAAGLETLGTYEPLPTGADLLAYWLGQLGGGGAGRMLQALADFYPTPVTKAQLGEAAGISHSSGTFGTYLSRLKTLELAETVGRDIRASAEFFE